MSSGAFGAVEAEYRRALLAHQEAGRRNDLVTLEAERRVIRALLPRLPLAATRRAERDFTCTVWFPQVAAGRPWPTYDGAGKEVPDRPGTTEGVVLVEDGPALLAYVAETNPRPNTVFLCVGRQLRERDYVDLEARLARLDAPGAAGRVVLHLAFEGTPAGDRMAEALTQRCEGHRFVGRERPAHGREWFGQYGGRSGPGFDR